MKKSRFLILATALSLFSHLMLAEVRTNPVQESAGTQAGQKVRTTFYKGTLIPVADLPEIEIMETAAPSRLMEATFKNGELTVIGNLPEVEIIAVDPGNARVPATYLNGKPVATVFLPVVEITGEVPLDHLVAVTFKEGMPVAVVTLAPIEITDSAPLKFEPQPSMIADWNTEVQSNPAIVVAHDRNGDFFLMSYAGTITDNSHKEIFIYKMISQVKGAVSSGLREMIESFSTN